MGTLTVRLSLDEEIKLEQLKLEKKMKTKSDVIKSLIANAKDEKSLNNNDVDFLSQIKNDCNLTLELLKQFYGEMSYKEYNPEARKSEKLKEFLDDYYNPEIKFMK